MIFYIRSYFNILFIYLFISITFLLHLNMEDQVLILSTYKNVTDVLKIWISAPLLCNIFHWRQILA